MAGTIRVLNVEDSEQDVGLITRHLRRSGYDVVSARVETSDAMKAALEGQPWDVILCDYAMPFGALEALALRRELGVDVPLIVVSGRVGEAAAVDAMRAGAQDYVMKDNLARLAPTIAREMQEAENRRSALEEIRERRRVEEERARLNLELDAERERLNNIVANVPGIVWEAWGDPGAATQRIDFVSSHVEVMLGYSVAEWLATPNFWLSIVHAEDKERASREASEGFASGRGTTMEFRWVARDGRVVWAESRFSVICGDADRPIGTRGVAIDVTERKRAAERQLRRASQAALRADVSAALAEQIPLRSTLERCAEAMVQHLDAAFARIWTVDSDEDVLELQASAGMYTHIDGPHGRVPIGAFEIGLIAQERRPHITNELWTDPRGGDPEWARREGMVAFAGYPLVVEDRLIGVMAMFARRRLADDTLDALASVADVISQGIERMRANVALESSEEQLRRSQKLEAIGQLAGGIAHDFNNVLMVIAGYCDLLLRQPAQSSSVRASLEEIKKAGERAASLTRQLLAFSRKQVLQPQVLQLSTLVENIEKMLHRLIGEDIDLATVLERSEGRIEADPGQIEQVILNLAINARDAMPEGGKLTIEVVDVQLDQEYAKDHLCAAGPYVMLAVSDTGCGMDAETQARVFEPFFTTKEQGTGLGLSTVYGIVKQSGGSVWAYSEVGKGTTFKVYLPRTDAIVDRDEPRDIPAELPGGRETLLLAEDEDPLRRLMRTMLEERGYRVLEAKSGTEALDVYRRHEGEIALIITDVVMPGSSGRELVQRLQPLRAGVRVIYMSGYTDDAVVRHGLLDREIEFLQKPFSADALVVKVRQVLDG